MRFRRRRSSAGDGEITFEVQQRLQVVVVHGKANEKQKAASTSYIEVLPTYARDFFARAANRSTKGLDGVLRKVLALLAPCQMRQLLNTDLASRK